jgi:xylan 1,4-beta-xylosidase
MALTSGRKFLNGTVIALTALGAAFRSPLAAQSERGEASGVHPSPVVGKDSRYVNPLNLEATSQDGSPKGVSLGDPTVVRDGNSYYMFATGGGPWASDDLIHWKYAPIDPAGVPVPDAPDVVKYDGYFYMAGNGTRLYRSAKILGPYQEIGPWLDQDGKPFTGIHVFDIDIFVDSDNKPYLYMAIGETGGIWVAPLDPKNLTRLLAAPKTLFAFESNHVWERSGDANERTYYSWIEAPWVFKRNGIYYLEYSASGTEWLTYATGVYTATSPLGSFTYTPQNPLLRKTTGIVAGPGHGSVVQGPNGDWWQFYLCVLPAPPGGRRIGIDPIGFDANGRMFVRDGIPTETPQWAPGVVSDPTRDGDSGSIPLSIGKTLHLVSSSQREGREAAYALDNSNGTWWEPAANDAQPSITVDLLGIAPFDKQFTLDSSRILFRALQSREGLDGGFSGGPAFRYKIESSSDGKQYTTLVDKTGNTVTRYTEFDELPPTRCRFVRLTLTDWPRSAGQPLGVAEFTIFGKYIEPGKPQP